MPCDGDSHQCPEKTGAWLGLGVAARAEDRQMEVEMGKSLRWKRVIVAVNSGRVRSVRCRARLVGPDRLQKNMLGKTVQCPGLVGVRTLDRGMPGGASRMVVVHLGRRHGGQSALGTRAER